MTEGETAAETKLHARHPSQQQLERFVRCELSRAESSAVVRHLLTNCPRCVAITTRLWGLGDPQHTRRAVTILLKEATRQGRSAAARRRGLVNGS